MKDEFLTFSEFAKLVKIDRSTLYRRVANTVALQQLVQQLATGQKVINRSAMRFFTVATDATTCNNLQQLCNNPQQPCDTSQQKIIDFLMAQIKEKDRQLEEKSRQIAQLEIFLDQEQKLNFRSQELMAIAEKKALVLEEGKTRIKTRGFRGGWGRR